MIFLLYYTPAQSEYDKITALGGFTVYEGVLHMVFTNFRGSGRLGQAKQDSPLSRGQTTSSASNETTRGLKDGPFAGESDSWEQPDGLCFLHYSVLKGKYFETGT